MVGFYAWLAIFMRFFALSWMRMSPEFFCQILKKPFKV